jgi:heterotetrameric sarcosine oxidase delta subunit
MLRIRCPHCGEREEAEFRYHGDASLTRPAADAPIEAFVDYVYTRANPSGWHREWWQHVGGCRSVFAIERNTLTHEVRHA